MAAILNSAVQKCRYTNFSQITLLEIKKKKEQIINQVQLLEECMKIKIKKNTFLDYFWYSRRRLLYKNFILC